MSTHMPCTYQYALGVFPVFYTILSPKISKLATLYFHKLDFFFYKTYKIN